MSLLLPEPDYRNTGGLRPDPTQDNGLEENRRNEGFDGGKMIQDHCLGSLVVIKQMRSAVRD